MRIIYALLTSLDVAIFSWSVNRTCDMWRHMTWCDTTKNRNGQHIMFNLLQTLTSIAITAKQYFVWTSVLAL